MKSHIAVAWVLGILGGAMFVTGLVRTMRKPPEPPEPPEPKWHDAPEMGDYTVVANTVFTTEANPTPLTMGPKEAIATDSMRRLTMFAEMPTPNVLYDNHGFRAHVITQAEAEEVVKALESHAIVWEVLGDIATNDGRTDSAKRCRAREADAKATLAKWRKRVEEGKP